jgi:hypothetical protein
VKKSQAAKIKVKSSFPDAECLGRQESLAPRLIRLHQLHITDQQTIQAVCDMASDIDSLVTATDSEEDDDLEIVSVRPTSTGTYYMLVEMRQS